MVYTKNLFIIQYIRHPISCQLHVLLDLSILKRCILLHSKTMFTIPFKEEQV